VPYSSQKQVGFSPCGSFEGARLHISRKNEVLYQGTTSVVPYSSQIDVGFGPCGSFEGARLQPCRNHSKMNPALAAEGRFFASVDFLRKQPCHKTLQKKWASAPAAVLKGHGFSRAVATAK
jgi:hypothetical protein